MFLFLRGKISKTVTSLVLCYRSSSTMAKSLHLLTADFESAIRSSNIGLAPSKEYIYTHPFPVNGADFDDLATLQAELPPTSAGYYLVDVGVKMHPAPRHPLQRGILYFQKFSSRKRCGLVTLKDCQKPQKLSASNQFKVPSFSELVYNRNTNLEKLCEDILDKLEYSTQAHQYLNLTGHYLEVRKNLGLPHKALQPGSRLMKALKHLPGIQSEFLYLSSKLSAAAAHEEDFRLPSANILYSGAPKLWTIIHPSSKDDFLSRVVEAMKLKPECDQFLRHLSILPRPSQLRKWGITFQVVLQPQGCLILVQPNAIHSVLNLGANLAGAINYTKSDWQLPPLYRECEGCSSSEPIRAVDFKISRLRSLDIPTQWELESDDEEEEPTSRTISKRTINVAPLKEKILPARCSSRLRNDRPRDQGSCLALNKADQLPRSEHSCLSQDGSLPSSLSSPEPYSSSRASSYHTSLQTEHPAVNLTSNLLTGFDLSKGQERSSPNRARSAELPERRQLHPSRDAQHKSSLQHPNRLPKTNVLLGKRKPSFQTIYPEMVKRTKLSAFLELINTNHGTTRLQKLDILGVGWTKFYQSYTSNPTPSISSERAYHIMAMVSAIGCSQVILDIASRFQSTTQHLVNPLITSADKDQVSRAYRLHDAAESSIMGSVFQKCLSELSIYSRFEILHKQHEHRIKEERRHRQRRSASTYTLDSGSHRGAASYALDELTAECLQIPLTQVEGTHHQAERKKIIRLKDQGKRLSTFGLLLGKDYEGSQLWYLFPMKSVKTPLDEDISVDIYR